MLPFYNTQLYEYLLGLTTPPVVKIAITWVVWMRGFPSDLATSGCVASVCWSLPACPGTGLLCRGGMLCAATAPTFNRGEPAECRGTPGLFAPHLWPWSSRGLGPRTYWNNAASRRLVYPRKPWPCWVESRQTIVISGACMPLCYRAFGNLPAMGKGVQGISSHVTTNTKFQKASQGVRMNFMIVLQAPAENQRSKLKTKLGSNSNKLNISIFNCSWYG